MDYTPQLNQAISKDIENIAFLAHFPTAKLENKLALLKKQKAIASRNDRTDALELLKIWEAQANDALILKRELACEDNPSLDIDMYLPEIETLEMMEKRQEVLQQKLSGNPTASKTNKFLPN